MAVKTKPEKPVAAPIIPAGLRRPEAALFLGISEPTLDRGVSAGLIPPPLSVGGCRIYARATLEKWLALGAPSAAEFKAMQS